MVMSDFWHVLIARPRSGVAGLGRLLAHMEHRSPNERVTGSNAGLDRWDQKCQAIRWSEANG